MDNLMKLLVIMAGCIAISYAVADVLVWLNLWAVLIVASFCSFCWVWFILGTWRD